MNPQKYQQKIANEQIMKAQRKGLSKSQKAALDRDKSFDNLLIIDDEITSLPNMKMVWDLMSNQFDSKPEPKPIPEPTGKRKEFCYRLEHNGEGIYNASVEVHPSNQDWDKAPCRSPHPPPNHDPMLRDIWEDLSDRRPYYFGFSSMEQFRRWFFDPEYLIRAQASGVRICIYQTDDFYIGDTQMIFRKETAKMIGQADLI